MTSETTIRDEATSERRWFKSSRSANNQVCVEVAGGKTWAAIRDSKNPTGPMLMLDPSVFTALVGDIKHGCFDR